MIFSWEHAISLDFLAKHSLRFVLCKRSLSLLVALALLLFAGSVQAQQTFTFTGGVQTFVVPPGVTLLHVDAFGAQGGQGDAPGGKGGRVETTIAVTPGETLYIVVGGAGSNSGGGGAPGPGGFNGGGDGGQGISFFSPTGSFYGGGGGGASDIRRGGTALANRIVVAGGGGGGGIGGNIVGPGGAGGDTQAAPGTNADGAQGGGGGTQLAGGAGGVSTTGGTAGTNGGPGIGGPGGGGNSNSRGGGGGGAGYFGGGGGGGGNTFGGGGGGGGSSFSSGTGTIHTTDFQIGNGMIVLTVNPTNFVYIASGDSVPAGQDIDGQVENKEKAYPRWIRDYIGADVSLYPSTCTDLIGLGVYNIAEPGDTTTDYLTRQLSRIIGCDPDLVSITIGADDLLVPTKTCITDNLEKFKPILDTPFVPDRIKIQAYVLAVAAGASGCLTGVFKEINTSLGIINGDLEAISNALVRRTDADILFTNYYNPFARTNAVGRIFEDFIGAINSLISLHVTARQPRTALVDLLTAFRGHEIGTECSYIAPLRQVLALPLGSQIPLGVHPNAKGQQVIASLAARVMRQKGFTPDPHTLSLPFVACATPNTGVTTGGTRVTLHGADFLPGAKVDFGNKAATVLNILSDGTQIIVNTPPADVSSQVNITVRNPDGTVTTLADGFSYMNPITR
jgi:hypothetical protein